MAAHFPTACRVMRMDDDDERDWRWTDDDEAEDPPELTLDDGQPAIGSLAFDQVMGEDELAWERDREAALQGALWESERQRNLEWEEEMRSGLLDADDTDTDEAEQPSPPAPVPPPLKPALDPLPPREDDLPF